MCSFWGYFTSKFLAYSPGFSTRKITNIGAEYYEIPTDTLALSTPFCSCFFGSVSFGLSSGSDKENLPDDRSAGS